MRPGRASDLPALLELWRSEVRAGRRDSIPAEPQVEGLLAQFDWGARSRVVGDGAAALAGAVVVSSRPSPEGIVARIDPAVGQSGKTQAVMRDLVRWGIQLSSAAGAAAAKVWVGPGQAGVLQSIGLEMVRPWWRMDRTLARGELPSPVPVGGYLLLDGAGVARGSWADMHNRSFPDHWRFSPPAQAGPHRGKPPGPRPIAPPPPPPPPPPVPPPSPLPPPLDHAAAVRRGGRAACRPTPPRRPGAGASRNGRPPAPRGRGGPRVGAPRAGRAGAPRAGQLRLGGPRPPPPRKVDRTGADCLAA